MPQLTNIDFRIASRSGSKGLVTNRSPLEILDNEFSSIQNMRFSRFGFGPRLGVDVLGTNANTATTGIKSAYAYAKADGTWILLRSHSTFLEWYDRVNKKWQTLVSGLTEGKRFAFAPFNLTNLTPLIDNNLVFCNGVENYSEWNGAIANILSTTSNTITITGSTTLANLGFSATGNVIINGTSYAYTGIAGAGGLQFTGVTGDPTGEADGSGLAQVPDTSTHSALPKMNILTSALARIWGTSDTSIRAYYSASADHTNFTSGALVGDPGIEDFPEGNGPLLAITQRDSKILLWKEHGIYPFRFAIYDAGTEAGSNKRPIRDVLEEGVDVGCAGPLAVATARGQEYYMTTRGGLHILGVTDSGNLRPRSLTDRILPSLKGFNNRNAAVGFNPNENLILVSTKGVNAQNQTETQNGTQVVYDLDRDALSIYKGLSISCYTYDPQDRKFLGHDARDAFTYEFDVAGKFSDETTGNERVAVNASAISKRFHFDAPALKKKFNLYMIQGYILPGATINVDFRYNDGGTKKIVKKTITGKTANSYVFTKQSTSFGGVVFGDLAFGAEDTDTLVDGMNPFRVYCKLPHVHNFNVEVMFYSTTGEGNGYWISHDGPSVQPLKQIDKSLLI